MRCPICGCDVKDVTAVLEQEKARNGYEYQTHIHQTGKLPTGSDWWEMPTYTNKKPISWGRSE